MGNCIELAGVDRAYYGYFYWQGVLRVGTVSFKNESNGDMPTKAVLAAVMLAPSMKLEG